MQSCIRQNIRINYYEYLTNFIAHSFTEQA